MKIFLSASVPTPDRDPKFYETVDVIAIQEAIRALVSTLVEQDGRLVFGGHPAITPMIRTLLNNVGESPYEYITLYQSAYFKPKFPTENKYFEKLKVVSAVKDDKKQSLFKMRKKMIGEKDYDCAVFIGGMEGIFDEFKMFRNIHPELPAFPIASTGAAALLVYEKYQYTCKILKSEYTYQKVFRHIFREAEN